jgi:hypothetical protein
VEKEKQAGGRLSVVRCNFEITVRQQANEQVQRLRSQDRGRGAGALFFKSLLRGALPAKKYPSSQTVQPAVLEKTTYLIPTGPSIAEQQQKAYFNKL